jgi:hypothetical protein
MIGPGKYDQLCSTVRFAAKAKAAIIIIIDGNRGSGFSCQGDLATTVALPEMLETMAKQIREDMRGGDRAC